MTTINANQSASSGAPARVVRPTSGRMRNNVIFQGVCIAATVLAIIILIVLLLSILTQGIGSLSWGFLTNLNSSNPHEAGIKTSLIGTVLVCSICALFAVLLGVGTAILIEEFKPTNRALLRVHGIIDTNIRNLAGVPSIVYGILGVTVFATMFGIFGPIDSGRFAIGQTWFDQYVDATGNQVFVPVKNSTLPTSPLYTGPVEKLLKAEIWRDIENEHGHKDTIPVIVDLNLRSPETIMVDQDPERDAVQPLIDENAPVLMKLSLAEGHWRLLLDPAQTDKVDFSGTPDAPHTAVQPGDTVRFAHFFDEQLNRMFYSVFTVTAVSDGYLDLYGAPITELMDSKKNDASPVTPQVMFRDDFQPIKTKIELQLESFESTLRDKMGDYLVRDADRNRTLTYPAGKEQETAEAIVDEAITKYPFSAEVIKNMRPRLVEQVLALNGKSSGDVRSARRGFLDTATDAEMQNQMAGKIVGGQNPTRVDRKSWYHFSLPFGRGVLAGGLTLMLVILPIVIVASQEALRAVPGSYRQGALAMGATRWQAVSKTALPAAVPGICTGTILAISRAIGEAAPILVLGGTGFITSPPQNLMDKFSAMPMTIFQWTKEPEAYFKDIAASGIIVLLVVLLSFNAIAIYIRQRASRHQ